MMQTVLRWVDAWPLGKVAATRPYLNHNGQVEDLVTKRANDVAWHPRELQELVRILKAVKPEWALTVDFTEFQTKAFPRARLLPGGRRMCTMVASADDLRELVELLNNVRLGRHAVVTEIEGGTFWDNL
jgi:hypothetical protein